MSLLRMHWLFNKRVGWTLVWIMSLFIVAAIVNVLGIKIAGNVQHWNDWLKHNNWVFFIWRMLLYILVALGWYWMRQRVIAREVITENAIPAKTRFLRIEVSAICALLVLEVSNWVA